MIPVNNQTEVNYDALFKVLVIGDSRKFQFFIHFEIGVGKSSILVRLIENAFHENHNVTIGVEFGNYVMQIDNQHIIQLQIWDTAGAEQYRSITRIFYKGSHAVILVYDVTSQASFENVRDWKREIENNADRDVIVYLVGNMADLEDDREVSTDMGIELMKDMELDNHIETSAMTGMNIGHLFETLTKHLYLENSGQLNEFREDQNEDKQRNSSISFKNDK